jgi:hypothetical protein
MNRKYYNSSEVCDELKKIINGNPLGYYIICNLDNDLYFKVKKDRDE